MKALLKLVETGLRQSKFSGITEMLRCITDESKSFGAVLFEAPSQAEPSLDSSRGTLYPLAQWFPRQIGWYEENIPLENSATGRAILDECELRVINDFANEDVIYRSQFAQDHNITAVCIVPLRFKDHALGSLNVFRTSKTGFSETLGAKIVDMARLVPDLYESIRDEVGYQLSKELNSRLQKSVLHSTDDLGWERDFKAAMTSICHLMRTHLLCGESSIFLRDLPGSTQYVLFGESAEVPRPRSVSTSFLPSGRDCTSLLSSADEPIRVLNLASLPIPECHSDCSASDHAYLEWMRAISPCRPISFMASPIRAGDESLGVIRCCAPLEGPVFFAEREVGLLKLLAGQIGQFVSDQRHRRQLGQENSEWRVLVESVSKIITLVYEELRTGQPHERQVFAKSLEMIENVLPGATYVDIRVRAAKNAKFTQVTGLGWRSPPKAVYLPAKWVSTLESGNSVVVDRYQLDSDEQYREYCTTLPVTPEQLILAPIPSFDQLSVLGIGNTGEGNLPRHAGLIALLLGQQLSLYHELATTIGSLATAQGELRRRIGAQEKDAEAQRQTFMDLEHQIRTPLRHARRRIPILLRLAEAADKDGPIYKQTLFLRGIMRKGSVVANSIGMFAELASGRPISLKKRPFSHDEINKMIHEACIDNEVITDPRRRIRFSMELEKTTSFSGRLELDENLVGQALNNLLDNAGKYSIEGSRVSVETSVTKARFNITVLNRGLKIGVHDVEDAKSRGWRSPLARATTGEGSGIGLWIASSIMKAHGGELVIQPTNPDGVTEVRLSFPLSRG